MFDTRNDAQQAGAALPVGHLRNSQRPASVNVHYQREEIAQAIALARDPQREHRVVPVYLSGRPGEMSDVPYGLRLKHGISVGGDITLQIVADRLLDLIESMPSSPALNVQVRRKPNVTTDSESRAFDHGAVVARGFLGIGRGLAYGARSGFLGIGRRGVIGKAVDVLTFQEGKKRVVSVRMMVQLRDVGLTNIAVVIKGKRLTGTIEPGDKIELRNVKRTRSGFEARSIINHSNATIVKPKR